MSGILASLFSRGWKRVFSAGLAVAWLVLSLPACQSNTSETKKSVTVGIDGTAVNSLIYIAQDSGYFSNNHLTVRAKTYRSGLEAVNGLLNLEVDLAVASEFVMVGEAFENKPVLTVASIDKFIHNYLIARKDLGISTVSDLKGKKIGLPVKTASEFYLGRFLELHGISLQQVIEVNTPPTELVDALINAEVDAVVAWQPYAADLENRLGDRAMVWPVQSEQNTFACLTARSGWLDAHPDEADQFLQALSESEDEIVQHPQEAKAEIQNRLGYDEKYIAIIWPEHEFGLSLDQSLILAMEDEARWLLDNRLITGKIVPDFVNFIYFKGMETVKPEAVNIIR